MALTVLDDLLGLYGIWLGENGVSAMGPLTTR